MEKIQDTLKRLLLSLEEKRALGYKDNPETLLKRVLSKEELSHVKFNYLRKGVLQISVDTSVWLYQLYLKKEKILAKLLKKSQAIKDIRFHLGEIN